MKIVYEEGDLSAKSQKGKTSAKQDAKHKTAIKRNFATEEMTFKKAVFFIF